RSAVGRRRKVRVAVAAESTPGDQHAFPFMREIGDLDDVIVSLFEDDGADRHGQRDVGARAAGAVRAFAVLAAAGLEDFLEAEIEERIEIGAGDEIDIAAGTAVAATGAAARNELLAAEAHGPAPAVSS